MFASRAAKAHTKAISTAGVQTVPSLSRARALGTPGSGQGHSFEQTGLHETILRQMEEPGARQTVTRLQSYGAPSAGTSIPSPARTLAGIRRDFTTIPVSAPDRKHEAAGGTRVASCHDGRAMTSALKVAPVDDPMERDADRTAERVMQAHAHDLQPRIAPTRVSRKCAACEHEEERLNRMAKKTDRPSVYAPGIVHDVLRSPGQPLDASTRAYFEPRFGRDFSAVRLHINATASASAHAIGAKAYAVGPHIVFGKGHSAADRPLMAHELAHVAQQSSGTPLSANLGPGHSEQRPPSAPPTVARESAGFWEKLDDAIFAGPEQTYMASKIAAEALKAAEKTHLPGQHNGPGDAWRHCYWNCRMTAEMDPDSAATIAENHEAYADNNPVDGLERIMDTHNNAEGQHCAGDCDTCCQHKLDSGALEIIENTNTGPDGGGPAEIYCHQLQHHPPGSCKLKKSGPTGRKSTSDAEKYQKKNYGAYDG